MNDDSQITLNIIYSVALLAIGAAIILLSFDVVNNKNKIKVIECSIEEIETSLNADLPDNGD